MNKLLSLLGYLIITLISRTMRVSEINAKSLWKKRQDEVVFAFWHGEQFVLCFHHRSQGVGIMSSLSKDGEIQSGILSNFGYKVVRGSSSKRGDKALVEMIRLVKKGSSAAFAVDGPKGPNHEVKPGIVYLAKKTGKLLVPVSSASDNSKILLRAWDKYELPLPFSKAVIAYGEPYRINSDADVNEEAARLESVMEKLSDFTHNACFSGDIVKYLDSHPNPKILIVQPSRLGDVVFSLPALKSLRERYPKAWIGWLVDERCAPVLENNSDLNELIIFDRKQISLKYVIGFAKKLREKQIDLSIDLHGLFKSAFLVALAGARLKLASASTNGMREFSWLFSSQVKLPKEDMHCVERHLSVAEYLGGKKPAGAPLIKADTDSLRSVENILAQAGVDPLRPLVAVHPGGGWISRRWFPQRYAALIDRLSSELNAEVVLVGGREGGSSEAGLDEEIVSLSASKPKNLTGRLDLKQLIALFEKTKLFIANEAGPMHIATAMGIPAIALLGPTNPARTGPFGGSTTVIRHVIRCQPCRERNCASRECMKLISVEEVFESAREKIKR
ncbi:MAG: lipopolysaccharide heptosyltransferase II [Elusimicrobia bacterium RIFOXYA1_FULL_47_7]|nr:MAG: lipopolysaccharide heptosyltransferase II [Elusimicrobia bacterium RIFOXYA1_FULL_47_7]